jgi:hypothetical protein
MLISGAEYRVTSELLLELLLKAATSQVSWVLKLDVICSSGSDNERYVNSGILIEANPGVNRLSECACSEQQRGK